MAKKARKAKAAGKKARGKKKVGKKSAVKKKAVAKKAAVKKAKKAVTPGRRGLTAAPFVNAAVLAHVGPAQLALQPDTKIKAVVKCVNAFMDNHHRQWDDDLQGDDRKLVDDYHEQPAQFLDEVNTCLEGKGFTIYPVPAALLQACATKAIGEIKFDINAVARPK